MCISIPLNAVMHFQYFNGVLGCVTISRSKIHVKGTRDVPLVVPHQEQGNEQFWSFIYSIY